MIRFLDSFDHYATAQATRKWTTLSATAISGGSGRRGTAAMGASSSWTLTKQLDNQPTWIIGCAFKCTTYPATYASVIDVRDGATSQVDLGVNAAGFFEVRRAGTTLGTSAALASLNVFLFLELLVTIHNTAGVVTFVLDGVSQIALTSQDTQNTANAYANTIRIGPTSSLGSAFYDDVYMCDGTGSVNNGLMGDCRVDALLPNGDGSNSAWTVSTGTTHSTLVDEASPNDDTDYLSTSTAAARDSHTLTNLAGITSPVIKGIQHSLWARKDDAGTREIKTLLKSGATTVAGATTHTLASTYTYYSQITETDPDTTAPWTEAAINALEAGMENV